jgi:glycosyltransferase involved in cell wall biosynthesis
LIHVNEHDNHPVAALAGRLSRVAVVTHLRFRPTREYAAWLFREGRVPSRLFFTSRTQMHDSGEALRPVVPESRWRVLPNGLDFSIFGRDTGARAPLRGTWGLADDVIAIGTACAISKRKRLDHFVRLIARLRQHGVNVHGFVAGQPYFADDTSYLHDLQQLVHDHRIETHLTFLGYVEPAEPLYHAWDLSVSTSSYETFGMAVLESMACACPVVSYPGGAVAEVAGDAASIVPDDDEDALFDECLRLARDPEARQKLGARGRERATIEYDIRAIVPLLVGAYREVAGP